MDERAQLAYTKIHNVNYHALCLAGLLMALAVPTLAQPDEQLINDIRMFTVMAAINVGGYEDGLSAPSDSQVRKDLRRDLESIDRNITARLKTFYQQHKIDDPELDLSQYISFALLCGEPPFFDLKAEVPTDLPPDLRPIRTLSSLLREFYELANIQDLWDKYNPAYEDQMLRYQDALIEAVFEINGYLRLSPSSDAAKGFKVYFDLLAAPGNINVRSYSGDVNVVVHSTSEIHIEEIRAAYLLHLLDRLSIRYSESVARKEPLSRFALYAPLLEETYKSNFQLLLSKSLAHAVQVRMTYQPENQKLELIDKHVRDGFLLTPYFYEKLAEFEKQPQPMRRYYETLVDEINVNRESARIQSVKFNERAPSRTSSPRKVAVPVLSANERKLSQAEGLLQLGELNSARKLYEEVLATNQDGAVQASYGLGRLSLDEADPDLALEHFAAAAEDATDARIKAMSHIYMGRIQDIFGNRDLAVEHYQNALDTGDSSPITLKFAQEGLEQAFTGIEDEEEP